MTIETSAASPVEIVFDPDAHKAEVYANGGGGNPYMTGERYGSTTPDNVQAVEGVAKPTEGWTGSGRGQSFAGEPFAYDENGKPVWDPDKPLPSATEEEKAVVAEWALRVRGQIRPMKQTGKNPRSAA